MKEIPELLSNCCKALLVPQHSDEGTSFYVCSNCDKPADINTE